jgi:hypothetical protein
MILITKNGGAEPGAGYEMKVMGIWKTHFSIPRIGRFLSLKVLACSLHVLVWLEMMRQIFTVDGADQRLTNKTLINRPDHRLECVTISWEVVQFIRNTARMRCNLAEVAGAHHSAFFFRHPDLFDM